MAMNRPSRVDVDVGELVLEGVAPEHQRAVAETLKRELEAGIARNGVQGLLAADGAGPGRAAPSAAVTLGPGFTPRQLGAAVARSIIRSWR